MPTVLTLKYSMESCANAVDIDLGLFSLDQKNENSRTQLL